MKSRLMFLPSLERVFYIFHIHMKPFEIQQLHCYNFLCSFNVVVGHLETIYSTILINILIYKTKSNISNKMYMIICLANMGYNTLLSYCFTIDISYFLPTYEETKKRLLNLRSNIKYNMLYVFFSSYVVKNERKESKTSNTFGLMLEASIVNFFKSPMSSSTRDSKEGFKCISSLALKLMVMAYLGHLIITNV